MLLVMNCEYGGMNEAFAQVYALTGDKKYLDASYAFYHKRLQDKLALSFIDVLLPLFILLNCPNWNAR